MHFKMRDASKVDPELVTVLFLYFICFVFARVT